MPTSPSPSPAGARAAHPAAPSPSTPRPLRPVPAAAPADREPPVAPVAAGDVHFSMDVTWGDGLATLRLGGELDMATAPQVEDAVAWLRRGDADIVVDTRGLKFLAVAGERVLRQVATRPDGSPDPRVVVVAGYAVARMRLLLAGVAPRKPDLYDRS